MAYCYAINQINQLIDQVYKCHHIMPYYSPDIMLIFPKPNGKVNGKSRKDNSVERKTRWSLMLEFFSTNFLSHTLTSNAHIL